MGSGLFGSTMLEIAIGLSFTYLLLALFCTTFNEWLSGLLKTRAKLLEEGIRQLLDDQPHNGVKNGFLSAFYQHPVIKGMMRDNSHPSYLPARQFAAVILDFVQRRNPIPPPEGVMAPARPEENTARLHAWIEHGLDDGHLKDVLHALVPPSGGDFATLQKNVEGWFDDAMDRVSGWHKRHTQVWTLIVATIFTVAVNADTFKVVRHLSSDPVLRQSVVESAQRRAAEPRPSATVDYENPDDPLKPSVRRVDNNPLHKDEQDLLARLIGWGPEESERNSPTDWLLRILGWLISVAAISLGAPFWFDTLNKFINIRSAGKSPDEAAKKPAKKKLPPADQAA